MNGLFRKKIPGSAAEATARHVRQGETGFTLVEILIAIVVLVVGLLGILSLFPFSMNNIQETTEFTEASTIASSFHQALLTGVHNAGTRGDVVTIHHSGVFNQDDGINEKYTFPLPEDPLANQEQGGQQGGDQQPGAAQRQNVPPTTYWIPCSGSPLCPDFPAGGKIAWGRGGTGRGESGLYRWQFGETTVGETSQATATNLEDLFQNIRDNFDPTIDLDQYSVAIIIRNRAFYPENLYEVLIRVYRSFTKDPGVQIPRTTGGENHKDLIREYRAKISK